MPFHLSLFTKARRRSVLRISCLIGGRIRGGWRLDVVVDAGGSKQPTCLALVYRNPSLRRYLVLAPTHDVVLDGAPHAVVGESSVLQRNPTTSAEQCLI